MVLWEKVEPILLRHILGVGESRWYSCLSPMFAGEENKGEALAYSRNEIFKIHILGNLNCCTENLFKMGYNAKGNYILYTNTCGGITAGMVSMNVLNYILHLLLKCQDVSFRTRYLAKYGQCNQLY